jgi:serine/threonine-protein kinase
MWLVLEHVDGVTLEELLERSGPLSVQACVSIAQQLVATLGYVHSRGIVHRDVHPKNVWISREGEIKLSNFFLAAEQSAPPPPELLEADSGFESPSYMSPEQLLGEATDPRSDLFSVGVIFYEMVTGHRPFDASDARTTTQRIRHEPPPAISRFAADVPAVIERIALRSLQKLPADRFQSSDEMLVMLDGVLTQYGNPTPRDAILAEMARAGLVDPTTTPLPSRVPLDEPPGLLGRALLVYVASAAALVGGMLLIRDVSHDGKPHSEQPKALGGLELAPANAGYLSCIVRPWANVVVNGQHVATTPFATPIALRPGTHYVRFDHPNAPSEQRVLDVAPGQRILLDIDMQMPAAPVEPEPDLMANPPDAGSSSP